MKEQKSKISPEVKVDKEVTVPKEDSKPIEKSIIKNSRRTFHGIGLGLIFITSGIILLLNSLNIVPWNVWIYISMLWPLVIINLGLQIIFRRSLVGAILTSLFILLLCIIIILFSLWLSPKFNMNIKFLDSIFSQIKVNSAKMEERTLKVEKQSYENIKVINLETKLERGYMKIKDDNIDEIFYAYSKTDVNNEEPTLTTDDDNETLNIKYSEEIKPRLYFFNDLLSKPIYEITLDNSYKYNDITSYITSGEFVAEYDLIKINNYYLKTTSGTTKIKVSDKSEISEKLDIKTTSGNTEINLSESKDIPKNINIDLTSGNITLYLPKNCELNIDYDITSGSILVGDTKLTRGEGNTKVGDGYKDIDLNIKTTSGTIKIEFK